MSSRSDTDETDRATSVSRSDSPAAPVSTIDIRQSTPEIDGKTSSNLSVDKESGGASKWGLQIMKKRKMDTIQESNQSTPTEVPSAVAPMSIDDEAVAAILKGGYNSAIVMLRGFGTYEDLQTRPVYRTILHHGFILYQSWLKTLFPEWSNMRTL